MTVLETIRELRIQGKQSDIWGDIGAYRNLPTKGGWAYVGTYKFGKDKSCFRENVIKGSEMETRYCSKLGKMTTNKGNSMFYRLNI